MRLAHTVAQPLMASRPGSNATVWRFLVPPNSALTRFIKQGLNRGLCPLCRVAYKVDGEYMWAFLDSYSHDEAMLDRLRRSRGFCAEHAERLRRLEVEGLRSNLGISAVYLDTLSGLREELAALTDGGELRRAEPCPGCANRDEELAKNARYLVEEIATSERSRERFLASEGICLPHLQLVWEHCQDERQRELVLSVQRRVVEDLIADLEENIRKQGHEFPGEPSEREADSWRRAIRLTVGWPKEELRDPPPAPEDRYQLPEYARITAADRGGSSPGGR
jgi:hypothetical protein